MWSFRRLLLLGACVLLAVPPCLGGPPQDSDNTARDSELRRRIREYDRDLVKRKVGLLGLRLSNPLRLSGSLGGMYVRQHRDYDCTTVCDFRGPFYQFEPGLTGAKLGVGYGTIVGEKERNRHYLRRVLVGFGIKGALMRTWGDASFGRSNETFLGTEADFTVTQVNFRLGLFRSVSADADEDPWMVTGGIGWGF